MYHAAVVCLSKLLFTEQLAAHWRPVISNTRQLTRYCPVAVLLHYDSCHWTVLVSNPTLSQVPVLSASVSVTASASVTAIASANDSASPQYLRAKHAIDTVDNSSFLSAAFMFTCVHQELYSVFDPVQKNSIITTNPQCSSFSMFVCCLTDSLSNPFKLCTSPFMSMCQKIFARTFKMLTSCFIANLHL
jgi:hypothetical protein